MKKFIKEKKGIIISFILGGIITSSITVYASTQYWATQIKYTDTKNVEEALNELYTRTSDINQADATEDDILYGKKAYTSAGLITGTNTQIDFIPENLKLIKKTTKIPTTAGKKYIISISVGSYTNQDYKPSITNGCTIIKENDMISATYGGWVNYTKSYIVTATGSEITISGNSADVNWNHITYYEL